MTTSQNCFLYYLSVWKIFSKNSFFQPSQGVSLSIADAKVDTFCKLTKHSRNFFSRFFNGFSQCADFQRESRKGNFREDGKIGIYMLQNMVFWRILGIRSYGRRFCICAKLFLHGGKNAERERRAELLHSCDVVYTEQQQSCNLNNFFLIILSTGLLFLVIRGAVFIYPAHGDLHINIYKECQHIINKLKERSIANKT